ncbi:hypothetical protein KR009_004726 [Drosophila setifemur]|nr:hypothetical protein KR009_004726 [Drosophila setifemur]
MFVLHPSVSGISEWKSREFDSGSRLGEAEGESVSQYESSSSVPLTGSLWHTHIVLLDYKQFKAARTIQRHVRGWLTRRKLVALDQAATNIAKRWRGFQTRLAKFEMVQNIVQTRTLEFYNAKATMIQALFRGWQTRQYFHDFQGMKLLRMQYTEDMLSTLARSLWEIKEQQLLPGIYALRETRLLSKLEDLTRTFSYRYHNGRVRAAIAKNRAFMNEKRQDFKGSQSYSMAPFRGPDSDHPVCPETLVPKKIGTSYQRVVLEYDKSERDRHVKNAYLRIAARRQKSRIVFHENLRTRFCKDVIKRLLNTQKDKSRLEKIPMGQFFEEIFTSADEYNCLCKPNDKEVSLCQ